MSDMEVVDGPPLTSMIRWPSFREIGERVYVPEVGIVDKKKYLIWEEDKK